MMLAGVHLMIRLAMYQAREIVAYTGRRVENATSSGRYFSRILGCFENLVLPVHLLKTEVKITSQESMFSMRCPNTAKWPNTGQTLANTSLF